MHKRTCKVNCAFLHIIFYMEIKFSERLNELMEEKGISSLELGKAIGVDRTTVLRWKNGNMYPTIDKLFLICKYFGESSDYLLGLND